MTMNDLKRLTLAHRNLVALPIINLALFTIAELTYNNAKHPGTVINVASSPGTRF